MQICVINIFQSEWRLTFGLLKTSMVFRVLTTISSITENDALYLTHIQTLRKSLKFHLIPWCGNFAEMPETPRKLCISKKFQHQEIRWNFDILRSGSFEFELVTLKFPLQNRFKRSDWSWPWLEINSTQIFRQ